MLKIHFLNVGKGNCTIIDSPTGSLSMVDIDNSRVEGDDTLTDPISYYENNFKGRDLFRFILTHPDMDHMSGLAEFRKKHNIYNFWDTKHDKQVSEEDWENSPYDKNDWEIYQKFQKSESNPKCIYLHQLDTASCCWVKDGVTILSPTNDLENLAEEKDDYNHLSYVLRIDYLGIKILLGGDASIEVWDNILKNCGKEALKADIFLAPHHGSKHNVNESVFEAIKPDYVIVSVVEGADYDYDYYSKLAQKKVLSTKHYGNMILSIDDKGIYKITVQRGL